MDADGAPGTREERDGRLARARACLDAYGADPARWPESDRFLFEKYKDDFRFAAARDEAMSLDEALALASPIASSEALRSRMFAAAPERGKRFGARVRPFGWRRRLIPASAMAGLSLAGFAAGVVSASDVAATARGEAAETAIYEALGAASVEDEP